jgi:nucleoside-diphosphate-sugar epimerase
MKVFLTGATGYIGSVVAEKLIKKGHQVLGLARNDVAAEKLQTRGIEAHRGDLTDTASLKKGASVTDGVIHTAFGHDFANFDRMVQNEIDAVNAFVEALQGTDKPFVATSAPAFLGDTGDKIADENYPIDEKSFFAVRARAEQSVLAANEKGVRAVALRLPFYVYGRAGSTFLPVLIPMAQRNGAAFYAGDGEQKVSAVHVEEAADLYVAALENESARGLYNVAAENVSNRQIAESIAKLVAVRAESISLEIAAEKFGVLAGFMTINNQISADKARRELGWQPSAKNSILADIERGSYRKFTEI